MNKRQQLINMIKPCDDDWQPLVLGFDGQLDPTYLEYERLRHRLGLMGGRLVLFPEGGDIEDVGDEAEKNRAEWRKFIKEHRNDDVFQG